MQPDDVLCSIFQYLFYLGECEYSISAKCVIKCAQKNLQQKLYVFIR